MKIIYNVKAMEGGFLEESIKNNMMLQQKE